jgi:hypothetical protein
VVKFSGVAQHKVSGLLYPKKHLKIEMIVKENTPVYDRKYLGNKKRQRERSIFFKNL